MFIRIERENEKVLNLSKNSIVSFQEIFEQSEDGKKELKAIEISTEKLLYRVNGTTEYLEDLVSQIVRQDSTSESDPDITALNEVVSQVTKYSYKLEKDIDNLTNRLSTLETEAVKIGFKKETEEKPQQAA